MYVCVCVCMYVCTCLMACTVRLKGLVGGGRHVVGTNDCGDVKKGRSELRDAL